MWQAAEAIFTQLAALGPLTTVLASSFAERYAAAEHLEGDEIQRALFVVTTAGYASRTILGSAMDQPSLDPASLALVAPFDIERIAKDSAAVGELIDAVGSIALTDFDSVMTLPPEIWTGYSALGTMQLQRDLASSTLTWRELDRDRIQQLLRYGYVLRCLDEVFDVEPELRED